MPTVDGFHYFTTIGCQVFQGYCPLLSGQTRLNQKQGDSISSILVKIRLPGLWKGCNFASKLNEDTVNYIYIFVAFWGSSSIIFSKLSFGTWHISTTSDLSNLFDPAGTLMSKCKDMAKADLSRWSILHKRRLRHRNRRIMPEDWESKQNLWHSTKHLGKEKNLFHLFLTQQGLSLGSRLPMLPFVFRNHAAFCKHDTQTWTAKL